MGKRARPGHELRPDVVTWTSDAAAGGLETLERLMAEQPVPVLLMSTLTQEGPR
jgi:chemotaxis response regulator CheB